MSLNVMNVSLQNTLYAVKVSQLFSITSFHSTQHAKTLLTPVHKQHTIATSVDFSA